MKNFCLINLLLLSISVIGQSPVYLNVQSGIGHHVSEYDLREDFLGLETPGFKNAYSISFRTELEFELAPGFSIASGLEYQNRVYRPMIFLGTAYGALLFNEIDTAYMLTPHLAKQQIQLFSFPVNFKRYFDLNEKHAVFFQFGTLVSFQLRDKENYQDISFVEEFANAPQKEFFSDTDKSFQLFGTSAEVGIGWLHRLTGQLNLFVQTRANLLEYRRANAKFKNNGEILWKESLVPLSQFSMNIGLQKSF